MNYSSSCCTYEKYTVRMIISYTYGLANALDTAYEPNVILLTMNSIQEQKKRIESEVRKLEAMGGTLGGQAKQLRDSTFSRFPILIVFLSTFGLVSTFYGFEKVIDQIPYFVENPFMVLVFGILTLAVTGTLFKKLN